jgi:inositol-phosphate phosphatase/L-galactose 1-phosphate phosphatase/histidinol-phosphatase
MISQEIIDFANQIADESAKIAQKYFRLPNGEVLKEDNSPVTLADQEIEEMIRKEIIANFPTHGIAGEEFGNYNEKADFQWIIDPIDGTSSFIIGRPTFGTLIGLSYCGKVIFGLMNQPITKERWIGIEDVGSFLNAKKIQTRQNCEKISDAIACTTSPFFFKNNDSAILEKLITKTKYQNHGGIIYGGDCYLYAMLASGFVDIVIDPGLKIYDYAALIPIIENAGGVVSDWQGNKLELKSGIRMLACANKKIQEQVLEIINILN